MMATIDFVDFLYEQFLGRPGAGDIEGRQFWVEVIDDGFATSAEVTFNFLNSPEFDEVVAPTARLYQAALGRMFDADGLFFWVDAVRAGASLVGVAASFIRAPEFSMQLEEAGVPDRNEDGVIDIDDATNEEYVDLLFDNVLGRPGEEDGRTFWVDMLDNGDQTRAEVMVEFSESLENVSNTFGSIQVSLLYQQLLDRLPDMDELEAGVAMDRIDLIEDLLVDPEYIGPPAPGFATPDPSPLNITVNGDPASPNENGVVEGTDDGDVIGITLITDGGNAELDPEGIQVIDALGGTDVLRLTGDTAVRVDFTDSEDQLPGADLDGDGVIENDGEENDLSNGLGLTVQNFEVFDAYARNPLDESDSENNFLANIEFDGTGFNADGVSTDGNIYLGGLGVDTALGGIGNDFMAGGGVAESLGTTDRDELFGGRNADFFFSQLSLLDPTDGNATMYDGGSTFDDESSQDSDWILLEAQDDDEPITATLGGTIATDAGAGATIPEIENLDASGNLYGFLNSFDAVLGEAGRFKDAHDADGSENFGIGSTGQLIVQGSGENNIVIGGYDNDQIFGNAGNDLLYGGNLSYLLNFANNPNLVDENGGLDLNVTAVGTVNDGRDGIFGDGNLLTPDGDDNLIFEMDEGIYDGGDGTETTGGFVSDGASDALWLTSFSMGRMQGHTADDELTDATAAQEEALAALTDDSKVRLDLGVGSGQFFKGYGGADVENNEVIGENFTADQTNYVGDVDRTTVQDIENVIATGLGGIDYLAAGTNAPDLSFSNQQNYFGLEGDLDLRGVDGGSIAGNFTPGAFNAADNILYANTGFDIIEGRGGDDLLMGGLRDDDFFFTLNSGIIGVGDEVNVIHRQEDDDGDGIWDGESFEQDFRVKSSPIGAEESVVTFTINNPDDVLAVLFSLNGVPVTLSGAEIEAATTIAELVAASNDLLASSSVPDVEASEDSEGNLVFTDPLGRPFSTPSIAADLAADDFVASAEIENGTPTIFTDEEDRLIFKAYAERSNNLGVDDQTDSLGGNAYAEDLVVGFIEDDAGVVTTTVAEGQQYDIQFQNLTEGDEVTISINGVDFVGTVEAGETTDAFVTRFVGEINNLGTLDISTRVGDLQATDTGGVTGVNPDESVLRLTEAAAPVDGAEHAFMDTPTVTVINPVTGVPGTAFVANTSNTSVELFEYDGRDNDINMDSVLFVGRTGQIDGYDDASTDSFAILATAETAGGTLNGKDAILVDVDGQETALHGDDLLITAEGNDIVNAGTGDDRIIGSAGTDTVDGGGNEDVGVNVNGVVQDGNGIADYVDTLIFDENDFGEGSGFTITVDSELDSRFLGEVAAVDAADVSVGNTTFTDVELVRTLSNAKRDTLNFAGLSDSIAANTGVTDMELAEGVTYDFSQAPVSYTADLDDDGTIDPNDETAINVLNVLGVENIIGGGANDTVIIDESQAGSTNIIDLGDEGVKEDGVNSFSGADTVTYNHQALAGLAPALPPTINLTVVDDNTTEVELTDGALGDTSTFDTLIDVEVVDVTNAAIGTELEDTIDTSGLTNGSVVNYGADITVGESLGANDTPDTAMEIDGRTLVNGGIAEPGTGLGFEVQTIGGIIQMERVVGSEGEDRVILNNTMQFVPGAGVIPVGNTGFDSALGNDTLNTLNLGLYQFDLAGMVGDGIDDMLDYRQELDAIYVVLTTGDTSDEDVDPDRIIIDQGDDGSLTGSPLDRVDFARGVERYLASQGNSHIDLTNATVDTTIEFSAESEDNGNEFVDPNGFDGSDDTNMLGIVVTNTADSTVYGKFVDDPNGNPNNDPTAIWNFVEGSDFNETVIFTDNESAVTHTLNLLGGDDVVDYMALTAPITATVNDTNTAGTPFTSSYAVDTDANPGVGDDVVTITRDDSMQQSTGLTLIATEEEGDTIDISALTNPREFFVVDLAGGVVIERKAVGVNNDPFDFITDLSGFENITGSDFKDQLSGDSFDNVINGGLENDLIFGGNGADTLSGSDATTPDGDQDRFLYTNREQSSGASQDTLSFEDGVDLISIEVDDQSGLPSNFAATAGANPTTQGNYLYADGPSILILQDGVANGEDYVINFDQTNFVIGAGNIDASDFVLRVTQSAGSDGQDLSGAANAELIYTARIESTLGARDEIDAFTSFTDGTAIADRFDFTALDLGRLGLTDGDLDQNGQIDAIESIKYSEPVSVDNANFLEDFFIETSTFDPDFDVSRAVFVQREQSTDNFRVFVDVNLDSDFNSADDMVIDLTNATFNVGNDPLALNRGIVEEDFIFTYDQIFA